MTIIIAIVVNLLPPGVAEFTLRITEGNDEVRVHVEKQEDQGWTAGNEDAPDAFGTFHVEGSSVTVQSRDGKTTQDLSKYLTVGATPFTIRHHPEGLDFLVNTGESGPRQVHARWTGQK